MNAQQAIKGTLDMAEMVSMAYLNDLTDEELMMRPHAECNHLNWQVGHLILSEHQMMSKITDMPALPDGFETQYTKETASSNTPADFANKETLLSTYKAQRAATSKALESSSEESLDQETGVDYAPKVSDLFAMQGAHWMMHCGQWVVVRRLTGKPVVI